MVPNSSSPSSFSYLFAIAPLALGHIAVPPLSYFLGERLNSPLQAWLESVYKHVTPQQLLSFDNVLSLTLDPSRDMVMEYGYRWFTSMFVHANYEHLLSNVHVLILSGYPVYKSLGFNSLYGIFLFGGACSGYPTFLHEKQNENMTLFKILPDFVNSFLSKYRQKVLCGSSGGIFSLMGSACALQMCEIVKLLQECHERGRKSNNLPGTSYMAKLLAYLKAVLNKALSHELAVLVYHILIQYFIISKEVEFLRSNTSESISYASHVQGYVFGLISTLYLHMV